MIQFLLNADVQALTWARGLIGPEYATLVQILGESIVVWVAIFLVGLWLRGVIQKKKEYKLQALEIFSIVILTFVVHAIINFGVPQWRAGPQSVVGGIIPLIPHPMDNSFPSGHALFTAAFLIGLWHSYRKCWAIGVALIIGFLTASARVIGGVHYPGDILGGWIFGSLGGWLAIQVITRSFFQAKLFPLIIRIMNWIHL